MGFCLKLPRIGQARGCERRSDSTRSAEGLEGKPAGAVGSGIDGPGEDSERFQRLGRGWQKNLPRGPDRAGGRCGDRKSGKGRRY